MPTPTPISLVWDDNKRPFTLTAKVDAVLNPTDTFLWDIAFVRGLLQEQYPSTYDLPWDGIMTGSEWGSQYIGDAWRFTALSGVDSDHPMDLIRRDTGELIGTLTAVGQQIELVLPPGVNTYLDILQNVNPAVATVRMTRLASWDYSGNPPVITESGNQFSARWDYTPPTGVLTARAQVYDANDALIAESSSDITLTIIRTSASGGGC
jgi:hypothetical protein